MQLAVTSMHQTLGVRVTLDLLQHNEKHEINAFYDEMFRFRISHGHLTPCPIKAQSVATATHSLTSGHSQC